MKNLLLILAVIGALTATGILSALMMKGFRLVDKIQQEEAEGKRRGEALPEQMGPDQTEVSERQQEKTQPEPVPDIVTHYSNGKRSAVIRFKDGFLHGFSEFYFEDQKPWKMLRFKNGREDGLMRTAHPDGRVRTHTSFSQGVQNGFEKIYYRSGEIWVQQAFKNGRPSGALLAFSEDGTPFQVFDLQTSQDGGAFHVYDEQGELKSSWSHSEGEQATLAKTYTRTKTLSGEWRFTGPHLDGESVLYHENGKPWKKWNFKKGLREGASLTYYEQGALWSAGYYLDGVKQGTERVFYPSGFLWTETQFENGIRRGHPRVFSEHEKIRVTAAEPVSEAAP